MFLMPSEEALIQKLQARQIQLKKLSSKANAQLTIQPVLEKMNAENKDLQHLAKRAVISYLRSVYLMKDKSIFKVDSIDKEKLARSYGLLNAPTVEIVSRKDKTDRVQMLREQALARKMAKQLGEKMTEEDSSDQDFFTKAERREGESREEVSEQKVQLSKTNIRKITAEGPYKGKNIKVFTKDGEMTKDQFERQKYLDTVRLGVVNESDVEQEDDKAFIAKVK